MHIIGNAVMLATAIAAAGCLSQVAPAPNAGIGRSSGSTPFDADPKARVVYLEFLDYGYESAKRGAPIPAQQFPTEHEDATRQGYLDGIAKWKEESRNGQTAR